MSTHTERMALARAASRLRTIDRLRAERDAARAELAQRRARPAASELPRGVIDDTPARGTNVSADDF